MSSRNVKLSLSSILPPTTKGPRSAAIINNNNLIIGSVDGAIQNFVRKGDSLDFEKEGEPGFIHEGTVFSLLPIPEDHDTFNGGGYFVSGGGDKTASICLSDGTVISRMVGHTAAVEGLAVAKDGVILTGGWDGSVRGWRGDACIFEDKRNKYSVQVLVLDDGRVVTASGDLAVTLYDYDITRHNSPTPVLQQLYRSEQAHQQTIRKIIKFSSDRFNFKNDDKFGIISCGNDGYIKVWNSHLQCVLSIQAWVSSGDQSEFIYDISVEDGLLTACGDDKYIKVFDLISLQITNTTTTNVSINNEINRFLLPSAARTIYKLPNIHNTSNDQDNSMNDAPLSISSPTSSDFSDILAVTSQGAYILTFSTSRIANNDTTTEYDILIAASQSKKDSPALELEKLPKVEVLLQRGDKDGAHKIVNIDGRPMVCFWSEAKLMWELIGEAMGSADGSGGGGSASKQLFEGNEYDHVVDVEIFPGAPPLKLAFNKDDDPVEVAQTFMNKYQIPSDSLIEIVDFISPYIDVQRSEAKKRERQHQEANSIENLMSNQGKDNWTYAPVGNFTPNLLEKMIDRILTVNNSVSNDVKLSNEEIEVLKEITQVIAHPENNSITKSLPFDSVNAVRGQLTVDATGMTNNAKANQIIMVMLKLYKFPQDELLPIIDLTRLLCFNETLLPVVLDPLCNTSPMFMTVSSTFFQIISKTQSLTSNDPLFKKYSNMSCIIIQTLNNFITRRKPTPLEKDRNSIQNPLPEPVLIFVSYFFSEMRKLNIHSNLRLYDEILRFCSNMVSWFNRNPLNTNFNKDAYKDIFMYLIEISFNNESVKERISNNYNLMTTLLQILVGNAYRVPEIKSVVDSEPKYKNLAIEIIQVANTSGGVNQLLSADLDILLGSRK